MARSSETDPDHPRRPRGRSRPGHRAALHKPGVHPFDEIEWEARDARHRRSGQAGLRAARRRVPEELVPERDQHRRPEVLPRPARHARSASTRSSRWSAASPARSPRWGREGGYFASADDADAFEAELTHILVNQQAAFNSPVWFNVGFEENPQCSACFILSVEDTMESILDWNTKEGMIFRGGSGSGHQPLEDPLLEGAALEGRLRLRPGLVHARRRRVGRHDQVGRQDAARGQDGRARRRPPRHPRLHLVQGASEEDKAAALRDAGFDMSIDGEGFHSIQYQNANNSVRVTRRLHATRSRAARSGRRPRASPASRSTPTTPRELMREIAEAAWRCADPGRPVRHDDQRLAHVPEHGADQRVQPLLRVHARRRLGLQPRLDQPDEVPARGRQLRRRRLRARRRHRLPGPGDPRRLLELPDRGDPAQRARDAPARARLRQPRRAADGARPALRLRRGPRGRRRDHRADDRPRLPHVGRDRRRDRPLRRVRAQPRAAPERDAKAPRRRLRDRRATSSRACSRPRGAAGTRRSSSASSTATATRRRRCWRRPARSAS